MAQKNPNTVCRKCGISFYSIPSRPAKYCSKKCKDADFHSWYPHPRKSLDVRFWGRMDKSADCWLWQGRIAYNGYGQAWYEGRMESTHRLAYILRVGPIPKGHVVCHKCDVKHCCNPAHLFIGTPADNVADMDSKGRRGSTKIPLIETEAIKQLYVPRVVTRQMIADKFGVSSRTIDYIRANKRKV